MKKLFKIISIFFIVFSLLFVSINKNSAKAYTNNYIYEETVLDEDSDNNKKLSTGETVCVVIGSIIITAGVGFSIYWFILRDKKEKKM